LSDQVSGETAAVPAPVEDKPASTLIKH
jgi:hypothetical protein